jgi:hypothetical protein
MSREYSLTSIRRVIAGCCNKDGTIETWLVYLPERLLWSPEGMAEVFRICRSQLAKPEEYPDDDNIREAWDSCRIVKIEDVEDGFMPDIAWREDDE